MSLRRSKGFSLVELAVVLAIVSLLLSSLMYTLSAQTEQRNFEDTRRRLEQAREMVLSFAIVKGRLPCPARYTSAASNTRGLESFCTTSTNPCTGVETTVTQTHGYCFSYDGYIPAATLGLSSVDSFGFAPDAWSNRLRYAVTRKNDPTTCAVTPASSATPLYTSAANLKTYGIACQPNDLLVCRSAKDNTGTAIPVSGADCGNAANAIMTPSTVVAVIFSTGKNGAVPAGAGVDEAANLDGNATFVFHTPTPADSPNGEFDDHVTWITAGELYGRLIAVGALP
jgi:prepilin-type N-terminal cleavage/methylation domain-containing protein